MISMEKISMITMIKNFHLKLMKQDYIFLANDLENVLAEFDKNQGVDVQNFTTTTNTTEMPNVSSGKTKTKQLKLNFRIWTSYQICFFSTRMNLLKRSMDSSFTIRTS